MRKKQGTTLVGDLIPLGKRRWFHQPLNEGPPKAAGEAHCECGAHQQAGHAAECTQPVPVQVAIHPADETARHRPQ